MSQSEKSIKSWTKIINAYTNSSLSKVEFCKQNKIKPHQLYYWRNRLRTELKNEKNVNASSASSFVPLKMEPSNIVQVHFCGIKLEFDSLPDAAWLAKVIKSMDAPHDQH